MDAEGDQEGLEALQRAYMRLGRRCAALLAHATAERGMGHTESEWRDGLLRMAALTALLLEDLSADVARLRAAGLWPWEQAPDKADADGVQRVCNADADDDEPLLRHLLEGLGEPDNM